ncbi:hypothetical protein [Colwellia psychrerythraea]|nr:hypothetical protein [Colwellia psychrerythraea]
MKNIIEMIKVLLQQTDDKKAEVKCNYPNNYYGDQCCRSQEV